MRDKVIKLGKETLIYGTSTIAARLFNFFLVPFYTYYLVTTDYGTVATVFAFIALTNIVYQYGMDQAYLRFAADKNSKDTFSTPFTAVLVSAVIFSAVIFALAPQVALIIGAGEENAYLIKLSCAIMAFDALNIIPFAKLRFEHKAWHFVTVRTLSIMVNVVGNILALAYFKAGIEGIFYAGIFASLASLVLLLPVIIKEYTPKFDKALFKEMFSFAWPFIPAGMASLLVNVIDKPILSHLAGLSDVGIYQANCKIGIFMMLIVSMFDQAWRPFFIQYSKKEDCKLLFAKILTAFTAVSTWVFLGLTMLITTVIKTPIFGFNLIHKNYWSGLNIIPLVLAGYLLYGFYINFMVAPVLTKKTKVLMWITLLGALASVVTNLTLVPLVGIVGAGWAIFASYAVMALSLFIFLQRNYPIEYEYKKITLMGAGVVLGLLINTILGEDITLTSTVVKVIYLALYPAWAAFVILKVRATKNY